VINLKCNFYTSNERKTQKNVLPEIAADKNTPYYKDIPDTPTCVSIKEHLAGDGFFIFIKII
jgi:hypothetical protein